MSGPELPGPERVLSAASADARHRREEAKRRQLTVMFTDLVDSAAMSAALDPEDTEEILGRYYATFATVVAAFDGYVARHLGDGLLVFFGHPVAHEDDAVRAVLAGLEMINVIAVLSDELEAQYGYRLRVRIGIHTGTVVLSDGTSRAEVDVFGAVPNLAARIQGAASHNSVVVSEATAALLRDRFELAPLEPTELKGFGNDVPLFRVVRPYRLEPVTAPRDVVIVGREHERALIDDAVDRVMRGGAEGLFLIGEAGIGKTKLSEYLRGKWDARGGIVISVQCSPFHQHTVFSPIRRLVEDAAGIRDGDAEDVRAYRLRQFAGNDDIERISVLETLTGLPSTVEVTSLSPERRRELTFAVLVEWLGTLAKSAPVLVLVEDLHWIDPSTLELLSRIGEKNVPGVLVVTTSRPEGPPPERFDTATIRLDPLATDEIEQLVEILDPDLSSASRTSISARSGGIPLFAEELVRMFERTGEVRARAVTVPPSLQDLFQSRLDVHAAERPLVYLIATLGEPATLSLLHELTGELEAELQLQLDALVDANILRVVNEDPVPQYWFEHVLLAEAAYEQQLRRKRRGLHHAIALTFEAHYLHVGARGPDVLAHHFEQAGCAFEAARYWLEAGHMSTSLAAYREAREQYRRGLAVLAVAPDQIPDHLELDLQVASGITLLALEGYTSQAAGEAYERARELCRTVDDADRRYRDLLGLWIYHSVRGNHRLGSELCDELVAAAEAVGEDNLILCAVGTKGFQDAFQGRFVEAMPQLSLTSERWMQGTLAPEMPQDPGVASWACRAAVHWILGEPVEARAAADRAADLAETLGPPVGPFTRAFVHGYLVWYGELARDLEYAAAAAQRSLAVSTEHGFVSWIGSAYNHLGMVQCLGIDPANGVVALLTALEMWEGAGAELYVPYYLGGVAEAQIAIGRPEDALRTIANALHKVDRLDERFYEAELHRVQGDALAVLDRDAPQRARTAYVESLSIARRQNARGFELRTLIALHRLERANGESGVEPELLAALEPFLVRPDEPIVGEAQRVLDGEL